MNQSLSSGEIWSTTSSIELGSFKSLVHDVDAFASKLALTWLYMYISVFGKRLVFKQNHNSSKNYLEFSCLIQSGSFSACQNFVKMTFIGVTLFMPVFLHFGFINSLSCIRDENDYGALQSDHD